MAASWYERAGFEVVDRNWRVRGGELDLVVRRGQLLVFAEVKARASNAYGEPAAAVNRRKQATIRRLAAAWLAAHDVHGVEVRFDVVCVLGVRVSVIEAAF